MELPFRCELKNTEERLEGIDLHFRCLNGEPGGRVNGNRIYRGIFRYAAEFEMRLRP